MKTQAAILERLNEPLAIKNISLPRLSKGQVLVEIVFSGLCHTQLNEIKGLKGPDAYLPHTLGHEGSGIIKDVGEGITKVKVGDHVVLSWIKGLGLEASSSTYDCDGIKVNSGAISTFMNYAVISENRVVPIPREMPLKAAALLGCAIPTGAGVIFNDMKVNAKNSLVIFGAGGLGLSAIIAAKYLQAEPIIVVDLHDHKLEKALALGATHVINAREEEPLSAINRIVAKQGVDFAFECVGRKDVMETAFASLKAPGGLCVLAGNLPKGQMIQIDPFELIRGKRIIGTWGGGSNIDNDIKKYTDLYLKGVFPFDPLITHEVSLLEINELFTNLEKGLVGRGLISF